MTVKNNKRFSTQRMVLLSILTALVAILSYAGSFIKIGGLASISLTLVPVVVGAALCGPLSGAWLGGVSAVVFFMTPDAAFWFGLSIPGTIITVIVKGFLAGLSAGLLYTLLERKNRYLAVLTSAVICPIVNTGIFLLGCRLFFYGAVVQMATERGMRVGAFMILVFVGLNFVFELAANIILSPTILRIINIRKGKAN